MLPGIPLQNHAPGLSPCYYGVARCRPLELRGWPSSRGGFTARSSQPQTSQASGPGALQRYGKGEVPTAARYVGYRCCVKRKPEELRSIRTSSL
jgi:hypothetical protein